MFNNYLATRKDIKTVEEALSFVLRPKMRVVFSKLSKISRTLVVSYDSKYIYTWSLNRMKMTKIPHNLIIPDKWQKGWWANIISRELEKYFPQRDRRKIINGGLLTPFITLQKEKNIINNPYVTKESYLATIIHEFGHIYFERHDQNEELLAFCTEYYASQLFWPNHVKKLDKFIKGIDTNKDQHTFALLNAKKLLPLPPKLWPNRSNFL